MPSQVRLKVGKTLPSWYWMRNKISPTKMRRLQVSLWMAGRALVVAVNKWDGISEERREQIKTRHFPQTVFPRFCQVPLHFRIERTRHRRIVRQYSGSLQRRHDQNADTENHPRPAKRRRTPTAAARRFGAPENALCPPRRHESARDCGARQFAARDFRQLYALPDPDVPQSLQSARYAAADSIQCFGKPV